MEVQTVECQTCLKEWEWFQDRLVFLKVCLSSTRTLTLQTQITTTANSSSHRTTCNNQVEFLLRCTIIICSGTITRTKLLKHHPSRNNKVSNSFLSSHKQLHTCPTTRIKIRKKCSLILMLEKRWKSSAWKKKKFAILGSKCHCLILVNFRAMNHS